MSPELPAVNELGTGSSRVERPDTVSALERGLAVLRCFTEAQPVLSHAELALRTGIPRPTVHRLVGTLVAGGLLQPAQAADRYTLGPGVVSLARVFLGGLDVRGVARPHLQSLADGEAISAYLAVRDGMEMVLIEACRPRSSMLTPRLDVGSRVPLPNSALGRAYLAALDEPQRSQLIESLRLTRGPEWGRLGDAMQRSVEEARRLGYAVSLGEFHAEINSVAVAFHGSDGAPMAVICGGAAFMFPEQRLRDVLAPRLQQIAGTIALSIGGHLPKLA